MRRTATNYVMLLMHTLITILLLGLIAACGTGTLFVLQPPVPDGMIEGDIEEIKSVVIECFTRNGDKKKVTPGPNETWTIRFTSGPIEVESLNGGLVRTTVGKTYYFTKEIELSTQNRFDETVQVTTLWATALAHELVHVYLGVLDTRHVNGTHNYACFEQMDRLRDWHACKQLVQLGKRQGTCDHLKLEIVK